MGQISHIGRDDVTLSLPNNLSGFIPLTSVSNQYTQSIEAYVNNDTGGKDTDQEASGEKIARLSDIFQIGQFLRAYVVSTHEEATLDTKKKRHIELSIKPQQANAGLSKADCVPKSMIQASVISVEDHGIIMDVGLKQKEVKGFLATRNIHEPATNFKKGAVYLCFVVENTSKGKTITLSLDRDTISNVGKSAFITETPSIDSLLPGTAIEFLVSEVADFGVAGKFMGLLDVTVDFVHSAFFEGVQDSKQRPRVGSKIKGRVICSLVSSDEKKVHLSLQNHLLSWRLKTTSGDPETGPPTNSLAISSSIRDARVAKVEPQAGLYLDIGLPGVLGFAHISKISDTKIDSLSETMGPFKVDTLHKARVTGYNFMDGLFILSLQQSVIERPFLTVADVKAGQVVRVKLEKILIGENGINGAIVELAKGVTGLIPDMHLSDVRLQHPERKFKQDMIVTARVLYVDLEKRQTRLTLKKSLVNSDIEPWLDYATLKPGMQGPGTLINILPNGAVIQFYGDVRGFLPISEMSESFIQDPSQHFQKGQVVNVFILSVDQATRRMTVSCKDPAVLSSAQQARLRSLQPGQELTGKIIEKLEDRLIVQLGSDVLRASLTLEHLSDGSVQKVAATSRKMKIGQDIKDVIVLDVDRVKMNIIITAKPSLVSAARKGDLLKTTEDVVEGATVAGYVKNISSMGVFVRFAGGLTGLIPKRYLREENIKLPDFGYRRNQSVAAKVLSSDPNQGKIILSERDESHPLVNHVNGNGSSAPDIGLSNPVDQLMTSMNDLTIGKLTQARITSVKETQLNVVLADGIQGRIDVSEVFSNWSEVKDRKRPLKVFQPKQILRVRVLGMHDSRNHRFLPISHRQGRTPVFELTAKESNISGDLDILSVDKIESGSNWLVTINNVQDEYVWVNLSPNVRGRIRVTDISDDIHLLKDMSSNFPVGSILRAKVVSVDPESNHLDLTARSDGSTNSPTLEGISAGMILPGRVKKVTDRQVIIQLSENLSGSLHLTDMVDDYSMVNPAAYQKGHTVRVQIKEVDKANKKVLLSTRPSKILSSSLPTKDPEISSMQQIKVNDVLRGFVKNVADQGLFVSLASNITAFVKISDLSDAFIKDWKSGFEVDKLIEGKVVAIDEDLNHVQMSLKRSHLDASYRPPLTFHDVQKDQVVEGRIRKVQDYGVFIVIENSTNVSGLCHRSQLSDRRYADPGKLFNEGDIVKAKILSKDVEKRQLSFGLKASYFRDITETSGQDGASGLLDDDDSDAVSHFSSEDEGGVDIPDHDSNSHDHVALTKKARESGDGKSKQVETSGLGTEPAQTSVDSLRTDGFDWTGGTAEIDNLDHESEEGSTGDVPRKRKRRKAEIKVDHTGDLDKSGPQSLADFERLLLGQPNSSVLWLSYMAFQLQLGETDRAREIAERALRSIHIREEAEKINVWVALMNLENTYGSETSLDDVFRRACQYNDDQEIHERLTSIYIQSDKHKEADELFQTSLKKFSQSNTLYSNYATFLMSSLSEPDRARALLPRAMQTLPAHTHVGLTSKFAQLEFKHGDPERGRTLFENLITQWPKRLDLRNVLIDMELSYDAKNHERILRLFERVTAPGSKLKPKNAKYFFKRWLEYEDKQGDEKSQQRVKTLAAEYVKGQSS